jgi:hypothetical protein
MPIVILTKSPAAGCFSREAIKNVIKSLVGRMRGPRAVTGSLLRGLNELGVDYKFNPRLGEIMPDDVVWAHDSEEALNLALELKKKGAVRQLVVGPSLGLTFEETLKAVGNPLIDLVLQASQWSRDFYINLYPGLRDKVRVWPAGVALPILPSTRKRDEVLIYLKKPSESSLLPHIESVLDKKGISYKMLEYGKYSQSRYFSMLNQSRAAIFLSNSESQGIALQEAWAHDVPTLVWNRGYMQHHEYIWRDKKISAPYLADAAGRFFAGKDDFEIEFDAFWQGADDYQPRAYVETNLSDKVCAAKFLAIINTK